MTDKEYLRRAVNSFKFMKFQILHWYFLDIYIPRIGYLYIGGNRDLRSPNNFLFSGGIGLKKEILEGEHLYKYNFGFGTKRKI